MIIVILSYLFDNYSILLNDTSIGRKLYRPLEYWGLSSPKNAC